MSNRTETPAEDDEVDERQAFFTHLTSFIFVNIVLIVINLVTSPDSLWFYWVTLFWGIGLASHALKALALDRRLNERFSSPRPSPAPAAHPVTATDAPVSTADRDELRQIMDRASALIDQMRASARQIPRADPRREALDACASADQVLAAIADHPDELPLARDFVDRFLQPASVVIGDYARLANRNVPSARETLAAVESHDLPLITRKADELYDRLHRGTLIDLQVAREMLTLDMADVSLPEPPANP
jgi:hypothetical protein